MYYIKEPKWVMFDYFLNASCTSLNKEFSFTKINIKTCLAIIFQNKHKIYLPCIHNSFYTEMSYYISYLNKLPYLQAYRVYRLMKDYDLSIICHFILFTGCTPNRSNITIVVYTTSQLTPKNSDVLCSFRSAGLALRTCTFQTILRLIISFFIPWKVNKLVKLMESQTEFNLWSL